ETMRIRKDGSMIDVSVAISPVYDSDGRTIGASAICRDVTHLRNVERDLAERESRIRLLLDSTAEGIIGLGPDGKCTFVNPSCLRLMGYSSADELIGKHIHSLIHPMNGTDQDHSEIDCPIGSILLTGQGTHHDEELLRRADGSEFICEYWSYPVRRGSQVVGIVLTFLD